MSDNNETTDAATPEPKPLMGLGESVTAACDANTDDITKFRARALLHIFRSLCRSNSDDDVCAHEWVTSQDASYIDSVLTLFSLSEYGSNHVVNSLGLSENDLVKIYDAQDAIHVAIGRKLQSTPLLPESFIGALKKSSRSEPQF